MTWLVALGHFLSVLADYLRAMRSKRSEEKGEALANSKQNADALAKTTRARQARVVERRRQRDDIDWLHKDDGYRRQ